MHNPALRIGVDLATDSLSEVGEGSQDHLSCGDGTSLLGFFLFCDSEILRCRGQMRAIIGGVQDLWGSPICQQPVTMFGGKP